MALDWRAVADGEHDRHGACAQAGQMHDVRWEKPGCPNILRCMCRAAAHILQARIATRRACATIALECTRRPIACCCACRACRTLTPVEENESEAADSGR